MNEGAPVVLPDQVIETLRQLLDDGEAYQWATGRFICDVIDEFPNLDRSDIVKQLADRTGADRSTLRDRHNMAKFYPVEVVAEYDMLSYSQLRACKSAGDEAHEYLEWATNNLPAPVAVIRARIKNNGHDQPAWVHRWESMQRLAAQIADDEAAPWGIRLLARLCVS